MMTALLLTILVALDEPPALGYTGNDELRAYLSEALEQAPALEAAHARWLAAMERIAQEKALDDPMFSYGQFVQSDMNRWRAMIAQQFPWFGTLRDRGHRAALEAEAALHEYEAERNRLLADVKAAYFDYAFLARQIELERAQIELLRGVEDTVLSRFSVGLAADADLLLVQMERARIEDELKGMELYRPALSARLSEAVGRMSTEDLPWPGALAPPPAPPPAPAAVAQARIANPQLAALDKMIESREVAIALARKKGLPDFTLALEYMAAKNPTGGPPDRRYWNTYNEARMARNSFNAGMLGDSVMYGVNAYDMTFGGGGMSNDDRDDDVVLSLGVNVPLWRKKVHAGIAEAAHLKHAAELDKRREELALDSAVRESLYRHADAQRRSDLYDFTLLPQAEQRFESLQTAYGSTLETSDFVDVLEGVTVLLEFELERAAAWRDRQAAVAEIEFLLGGPWTHAPEAPAEVVAGDAAPAQP